MAQDCCIEVTSHYPLTLSWRRVYDCIYMVIYLFLQIASPRGGLVYIHDADTYLVVRLCL